MRQAPSQSSTWDEETRAEVTYDKHQVLSMQIQGGEVQKDAISMI